MIIVGSSNSNRSEMLVNEYTKLLKGGANSDEILFLTLNSYKKRKIINILKPHTVEQLNVQTFLGLCYNTVLNNWAEIEKHIHSGAHCDTPSLCGLEVSQSLLLEAVKEAGFKDYNSKINLVHQLLRRHALIVNNNLSEEDVIHKSQILNETFADDAKRALDLFKAKTLELRAFDYIRQQSLFKHLYEKTDALKKIKYLFIDDYDEQTPACTDFFKFIKPQLTDFFIGLDEKGSSRCGYLCADTKCTEVLKYGNVIAAKEPPKKINFESRNFTKRLEMLEDCISKTKEIIKNGVSPEEISVITPSFDNQLKFIFETEFEKENLPLQFISGSEKLVDIRLIKSTLSLLRILNGLDADVDEVNNVFANLLNIPQKYACPVLQKFSELGGFIKHDFKNSMYNDKYNKFLNLHTKVAENKTLTSQMELIYRNFVCEIKDAEAIEHFGFLSKQIRDLERTLAENADKNSIITQLENSIIAENDTDSFVVKRNAVVISTPQKIIDLDIKTKIQFWLDTSSDDWVKQDTGTIYNAWVFQKNWHKDSFTYEDSISCVKEKTKRVLRKLYLLSGEKIFTFASNYNSLGQENNIGISEFLKKAPKEHECARVFNFTPRDDQKDILDYESGKLAITAVPGAGKTTVLQALIAKLIASNIPPENIFVLTYMDSAAKNIKERISTAYPDLETLPNITTIHGLALRIIKENGNYAKVNLAENFDICDDIMRQKLIQESIGELGLKYDEYEKYEKGISIAKFTYPDKEPKTKELKEFIKFFKTYHRKLSEQNLIDYDDMLILAVKLLENNPEIREYYRDLCLYVIEDEAQDSSAIQQRLISLLSEKHNNIVRCGDLNQAITTTFTNADISGFKKFIKEAKSTEMNHSQRCARAIFELANTLIDKSDELPDKTDAFYKIKMHEVEGRNPGSQNAVSAKVFDNEDDEKNTIIKTIKEIFRAEPSASAAILLRNNFQVNQYAALLKENGIPTLSRTDCLEQNSMFNIILSILKFCNEPWDNYLAQEVYKNLFSVKEENLFLSELRVPFVATDTSFYKDEKLIQLHWELNFWLSNSSAPYEYLALKIGEYYCKNEIDRANLFIIAEIIRRISLSSKNKKEITQKLSQIAKKPTISGLKLFSENENTISTNTGGKVQIMTMHKAKGDEFDYVFVPELTETSLAMTLKNIKNSEYIGFYEELKALNSGYVPKNAIQIKREILEENLRLLYVTITRAKLALFFSSSKSYKKFGRTRQVEPSILFDILFTL